MARPDLTEPGVDGRLIAMAEAGRRLEERPLAGIVRALADVCGRWADPADPDRVEAERALAAHWGAPRSAIAEVLDAGFAGWTETAILEWVAGELGDPAALDEFVRMGSVRRRASGPRLLLAIAARGVPTTPVADVLAGLLVKAPMWLKPAAGSDDLAARLVASLAGRDPDLGDAVEVAGWESGSETGREVMARADVVVGTGRAETISALRSAVGPDTRLVVHGPRLSAAILTREALNDDREASVLALARDVAFAGQAGCLSPVVAYVEGGSADAAALVERVLDASAARWPGRPRVEAPAAERAAFAEWVALAGVEAAAGSAGPWRGGMDEAWTVQVRAPAGPPDPPPVPRLLVVSPVARAAEVAALCSRRRGLVASVGVAGPSRLRRELAGDLARAGVERVAPLGAMQRPPIGWRRDGRTTLGELVRWTDLEG